MYYNLLLKGKVAYMNILIVDDQSLLVQELKDEIQRIYTNAHIDTTTDPKTALTLGTRTRYDIALLDIEMPHMNGMTLAQKLTKAHPLINIIFVTIHEEYALEAYELYASAFLLKPVSSESLRKAFENLRHPVLDLSSDFSIRHYSGGDAIGERIQRLRTERNLTRQDLAELMGVTRQTIHRWEHGKRIPDIIVFLKLSHILGVTVEEMLLEQPGVNSPQEENE